MENKVDKKKFLKVYLPLICLIGLIIYFIADYIIENRDKKIYYGTLEMDRISVAPEFSGKITSIYVEEGDTVVPGQPLAMIDPREHQLKSDLGTLNIQTSENRLLKTLDGTREEEISSQAQVVKQLETQVEEAKKNIVTAESALNYARSDYSNKKKIYRDTTALVQKKFESQYALDTATLNYDRATTALKNTEDNLINAKSALIGAEAHKKSAEEHLRYMINGFSKRDIKADKLGIQSSEKNLELSNLYLEKNTLTSAVSGIIETLNFKKGEVVGTGTAVITMLDTDKIWTKIYVPEKLLPSLELGQKVDIKSDFVPHSYQGEIIYIASDSEFAPMNIVTKKDRLKLVYLIKVKVLNNDGKLKSGMLTGVKLVP